MTRASVLVAVVAVVAVGMAACSSDEADTEPPAPDATTAPEVTSPTDVDRARSDLEGVDVSALRLDQPWRPAIHFAPPYGWMNDPNGLSFVDGRYHLFFQYNPFDIDFGDIGWGHAVSDNLTDWETWPVAIQPEPGQLIFSGSLVHDIDGTSPLCEPNQEPSCLVAVYTTHRSTSDGAIQTQDIAVSDPVALEFTKFEGNPVLDLGSADFRDPKVFWHEGTGRWIMVVVLPIERQVVLFGSPDLVVWEELSRFGPSGAIDGIWECPDLFPAPVTDGGPDAPDQKWVMKVDLNPDHIAGGSGGQYFLGEFDGTTFVADDPDAPLPRWVDWGPDFYCATTFHGGADDIGRPLWLGWMNNWNYATELPTFPWRGSMTVPRRIELTADAEGRLALTQRLADEVTALAAVGMDLDEVTDAGGLPDAFLLEFDPPADGALSLEFQDVDGNVLAAVIVDADADSVQIVRPEETNAGPEQFAGVTPPAPLGEGPMTVLVDRASIEVFADGGRTSITSLILPIVEIADVFVDAGDADVDVRVTPLAG